MAVLKDCGHCATFDGAAIQRQRFVESSLLKQIEFRKMRKEFIARGLVAREQSEESGNYVSKAESLASLDAILKRHRKPE